MMLELFSARNFFIPEDKVEPVLRKLIDVYRNQFKGAKVGVERMTIQGVLTLLGWSVYEDKRENIQFRLVTFGRRMEIHKKSLIIIPALKEYWPEDLEIILAKPNTGAEIDMWQIKKECANETNRIVARKGQIQFKTPLSYFETWDLSLPGEKIM